MVLLFEKVKSALQEYIATEGLENKKGEKKETRKITGKAIYLIFLSSKTILVAIF